MTTLNFPCAIGDRVFIPELQRPGTITALKYSNAGSEYLVRYFDDGEIREEWLLWYEFSINP